MSDFPEAFGRTMGNITLHSLENLSELEKESVLNQVQEVERSAWPDELVASREKFLSRLIVFPQGFIVAQKDGVIKGTSTSQITTYDPDKRLSWDQLTDKGFIRSTHDSSGSALYVVSVAVSGDTQGLGLGGKLVQAQKDLARKLGKKYLFLGARIPGYNAYHKEHGEIPVEEYLTLKNEKDEPVDPEIRFYVRQGLKPTKIIPNFEPDPDSRDYGVVMLWENS